MEGTIEDFDYKLGQGFTSADTLEEVDIRPGDRPRPTFISTRLNPDLKASLITLLKEYKDYFAWEHVEPSKNMVHGVMETMQTDSSLY